MTFVPLVAFDLAAPGDAKPFGRGSVGPDFWHCVCSFEEMFRKSSTDAIWASTTSPCFGPRDAVRYRAWRYLELEPPRLEASGGLARDG